MSQFITPEDYDASIHAEILDSVVRSSRAALETLEDRAVAEMRGYLAGRYDVDAIFAARGPERNQLVLMRAVDIAIYHAFCAHNPQKMSAVRLRRYDDALDWLRRARTGEVSIDGAPRLPGAEAARADRFVMRSNAKRETRL